MPLLEVLPLEALKVGVLVELILGEQLEELEDSLLEALVMQELLEVSPLILQIGPVEQVEQVGLLEELEAEAVEVDLQDLLPLLLMESLGLQEGLEDFQALAAV